MFTNVLKNYKYVRVSLRMRKRVNVLSKRAGRALLFPAIFHLLIGASRFLLFFYLSKLWNLKSEAIERWRLSWNVTVAKPNAWNGPSLSYKAWLNLNPPSKIAFKTSKSAFYVDPPLRYLFLSPCCNPRIGFPFFVTQLMMNLRNWSPREIFVPVNSFCFSITGDF